MGNPIWLFLWSFISLSPLLNARRPSLPEARARIRSSITVPIGSRCLNRVPAYLVMEDTALLTGNNLKYRQMTERDCMTICSDNLDFQNQNILCAGFTYDHRSKTCYIHRNKAKPSGIMPTVTAPRRRYFEKFCLPEEAPIECGEGAFFRAQQTILVGYAINVTIENNLEDCVATCIRHKDYCKSSMFFYNEGECIMNSGTAQEHAEVYSEEPDDSVVYFENGCFDDNQIRRQKPNAKRKAAYSNEYVQYNVVSADRATADAAADSTADALLNNEEKQAVYQNQITYGQQDVRQLNNAHSADSFVFEEPSRPSNGQPAQRKFTVTNIETEKSQNFVDATVSGTGLVSKAKDAVKDKMKIKSIKKPMTREEKYHAASRAEANKLLRPVEQPVKKQVQDKLVDNLVAERPRVSEWEQWSACDRAVDGRRVRRRQCIPQNALCAEVTTQVEWCAGVGAFNVQQVKSGTSNSISALPQSKVIVPSTVPNDKTNAESGFSQWDNKCRSLNPPQPCQNGFKLGFQSRQCHASPFQCLGSFFRYCFMPC